MIPPLRRCFRRVDDAEGSAMKGLYLVVCSFLYILVVWGERLATGVFGSQLELGIDLKTGA